MSTPNPSIQPFVVHVDARTWPVPPEKKLAGLCVFLRTLLTLEKAGAERIDVYAKEHQPRLKSILQRRSPRIPVVFLPGDPPESPNLLPACCLPDAAALQAAHAQGRPLTEGAERLSNEADFTRAQKRLWSALRKPIENDGVVAYFLGRPVSRIVSRLLVNTPVTPNAVTVASFLTALMGAAMLPRHLMLGAVLYWFSFVLDCVDGELARLRFEGSRLGQWLDTLADDGATVAFSLGLSCAMLPHSPAAAIAGYASALAYAIFCIPVYRQLSRMPVVDTAQYPYFFMGERGAASAQKNFWVWSAYAFRRDSILFAHMTMSFFSFLYGMFALQFVVNVSMAFITGLDVLVKAFRRRQKASV